LPADSNPALAREERMDLKATVDASGRVTRVELLAPRDENLVTLAADAASAWRFAPAQFDGRPVPADIVLHFSFGAGSAPETAAATAKLP
jgi:TonB family protein